MAKRRTSGKPYPTFPLFMHSTGQWAKKVAGKTRYFGTDWREALKQWEKDKDALYAGRDPRPTDGITLRELCNRFLSSKRTLIDSGELSPRTWKDYHDSCERLIAVLGKDRPIDDLAGDDFEKLRATLAKTRGPVALGNEVQRVRTILKYAFDESLIDRPVRFGSTFKKPSRKKYWAARHAAERKIFEAGEVQRIVASASGPLKAMTLLGIICGFGPSDVGSLPISALDLKNKWVNFPLSRPRCRGECRFGTTQWRH